MHIEVDDFLVECSVDRQHASFGAESHEGRLPGDTEKAILDNGQTSSFSVLSNVIIPPITEIPQKTTPETNPDSKAVMRRLVSFLDHYLTP